MPRSIADKSEHAALGARIRRARIMREMSQEKLGAALNLTFQQVQKYEKGVNRVSAPTLVAISQALDVELAFFLPAATTPDTSAPRVELEEAKRDLASALAAFDRLAGTIDAERHRLQETADRIELALSPSLPRKAA